MKSYTYKFETQVTIVADSENEADKILDALTRKETYNSMCEDTKVISYSKIKCQLIRTEKYEEKG